MSNLPEDEEEEVTVYTVVSDEGEELEFELLEVLEVKGKKYGVFAPFIETGSEVASNSSEEEDDEEGLLILRLVQRDNEEVFEVIEDDEEFTMVADELDRLSEERYPDTEV